MANLVVSTVRKHVLLKKDARKVWKVN